MADERIILAFLIATALFLQSNFNPLLGSFYVGMVLGAGLLFFTDPKKQFRFGRISAETIIGGFVLTGIFLLFSFILGAVLGSPQTLQSILEVFAQAPVLEQVLPIKIATFGLFIPIVETLVMLIFYELSLDYLGREKKLLAGFIIAAGFMLFHLTVKGVADNFQLAQTFGFAALSVFAFERWKEGSQAVIMHIFVNLLAILTLLNLLKI